MNNHARIIIIFQRRIDFVSGEKALHNARSPRNDRREKENGRIKEKEDERGCSVWFTESRDYGCAFTRERSAAPVGSAIRDPRSAIRDPRSAIREIAQSH
jgi:hypothetical protein